MLPAVCCVPQFACTFLYFYLKAYLSRFQVMLAGIVSFCYGKRVDKTSLVRTLILTELEYLRKHEV